MIEEKNEQEPLHAEMHQKKQNVPEEDGEHRLRTIAEETVEYIPNSTLKRTKHIGEGSFADVYLGRMSDKKPVAIKSLKKKYIESPAELSLFLEEMSIMSKLKDKHIVEFIGIGCISSDEAESSDLKPGKWDYFKLKRALLQREMKELYIVQEFCAGGSLRDIIVRQMSSPWQKLYSNDDALRWSLDLANAVKYLHREGKLIHRDIKCDNLLMTNKNLKLADAKLSDFGLARSFPSTSLGRSKLDFKRQMTKLKSLSRQSSVAFDRALSLISNSDDRTSSLSRSYSYKLSKKSSPTMRDLTREVGSYSYMAPEVLRGDKYNEKADIFSIGCCMYNIFYRTIPSILVVSESDLGVDALHMYACKVAEGWRPELKASIASEAVNHLISVCWSDDPEKRPSASFLVDLLEQIEFKDISDKENGEHVHSSSCCCTII